MGSLSFNRNKNKKTNKQGSLNLHRVSSKSIPPIESGLAYGRTYKKNLPDNQIISGYFVKEKSYKEMAVARVNTFLCLVLAVLVSICLVSYYFVTMGEISLNQIRKETLALNYENEDLQNKLDNLQSYYNVDKAVAKSNMLQRATKVMELSAASIPSVRFENQEKNQKNAWSMGY